MEKMVNLLNFWDWTFIMHIARIFVIYNVSRSFFKEKYKTIVTLLCYFLVLFPSSWAIIEISGRVQTELVQFLEIGAIIFLIIATFLLLILLTTGKTTTKFFVSILSVFSYGILAGLFNSFAAFIEPSAILSGFTYEIPFSVHKLPFAFFLRLL